MEHSPKNNKGLMFLYLNFLSLFRYVILLFIAIRIIPYILTSKAQYCKKITPQRETMFEQKCCSEIFNALYSYICTFDVNHAVQFFFSL